MAIDTFDRSCWIGGSDIAAILGLSRWTTALHVWAEKTGQIAQSEPDTEFMELGSYLEDYVARRFSRETGKTVMRRTERATHPKYPHFRAQIDRLIVNEDALLECKTCGERMAKEWADDQVPAEYLCQVMWQLACTGRKVAYIAVLIGNREFKWKMIPRDPVMIAEMLKRANAFWNDYVLAKVMPSQITSSDADTLLALFPHAEPETKVDLGDEVSRMIEVRNALYQDCISLENQISQIENELKAKLGPNESGTAGAWLVRWRNQKRKAYTVAAAEFRKFEVKENKQWQPQTM